MEPGKQGITPALPSPPQQHQANERIKKESESAQKYQSLLWQIICIVKKPFCKYEMPTIYHEQSAKKKKYSGNVDEACFGARVWKWKHFSVISFRVWMCVCIQICCMSILNVFTETLFSFKWFQHTRRPCKNPSHTYTTHESTTGRPG